MKTEAQAILHLVSLCLADGENSISVACEGEFDVVRSLSAKEVVDAIEGVCDCSLHVRGPDRARLGTFYLVLGNEPDELVADCSDNAYCTKICDEFSAWVEG